MEPEAFKLLMARLDRIEKQNDDQLDLMRDHITEDRKVYKVVDRHSTYFKLATPGLTAALGYVLTKLGLK